MDFDDTREEAEFRARARAWITKNAPHELHTELVNAPFGHLDLRSVDAVQAARQWQSRKARDGWACLSWPEEYGGQGAPQMHTIIWSQEEAVYSRLGAPFLVSQGSLGPTIMTWGTEAQKQKLLPPIVTGVDIWCQLFSEPAAGSDLAGIRTRSIREQDGSWTLKGQKIWSSGAREADWGVILTRSDPDAVKHHGMTMFFIDMRAPGVVVRPIRQITEQSHLNEVYLDNVRVPDEHRIGPVGAGWKVALTMLTNERITVGSHMPTGFEELFSLVNQITQSGVPAVYDRSLRSRLAGFASRANGLKYTYYRALTELSRGGEPGPEMSIMKLVAASTMQEIATLALDLQGLRGAVVQEGMDDNDDRFQMMLLRSAGARIEGGTDQVMRTIIAERVLGLPQDMRADKGIPFSAIPTSPNQKAPAAAE